MIESGREVLAKILYIPSSDTHIITYKGEFKKGFFLKDFAREIIGVFREPFISFVAEIPSFIFLIIWMLLFLLLILISEIFELGTSLLLVFFFLGIILKDLKPQFFYISEYHKNTKCTNCGKEFICYEVEKPDIKEISTPDDLKVQATRYWKCKACSYLNVRKSFNDFLLSKNKPKKPSSLVKIACKRCGKTGAYIEYKNSDKIVSKGTGFEEIMIRNYYKCKFCGFEDLKTTAFKKYYSD